ncbi:MAG: arcadin 1 [Thermoprotei archaeon]
MSVRFECKVTSIHPAFDANGNEFVCVEFAYESAQPPSVLTLPKDAPPEASAFIPLLQSLPKTLFRTQKSYSNRLVVYLTPDEWEKLPTPYRVGDSYTVSIGQSGELEAKLA